VKNPHLSMILEETQQITKHQMHTIKPVRQLNHQQKNPNEFDAFITSSTSTEDIHYSTFHMLILI
jgi:hypothetical protein